MKTVKITIELTIEDVEGKVDVCKLKDDIERTIGGGATQRLSDVCWAIGTYQDTEVKNISITKSNDF